MKLWLPGFVDLHSHLRDPGLTHKEDLQTGLRAAARGGFTTVCAMANTAPVIDTPELAAENERRANALELARYVQIAAIGKGLDDKEMVDFGGAWQPLHSNDGNTIWSDDFMRNALRASVRHGFTLCVHASPEHEIVQRDLRLLREVGGNLHICHVSQARTIALIRAAKSDGLRVTCEVTPHHLYACDMDYPVSPPIGTKEDRAAVRAAVRDGVVDALATDHAPHTAQDKANGAPGICIIEAALPLLWTVFREEGWPVALLSSLLTWGPLRILGRGSDPGGRVLVDLDAREALDVSRFQSKSRNCPFDGAPLFGRIEKTIYEGTVTYDCDKTV